jgi:hypothetical protein
MFDHWWMPLLLSGTAVISLGAILFIRGATGHVTNAEKDQEFIDYLKEHGNKAH